MSLVLGGSRPRVSGCLSIKRKPCYSIARGCVLLRGSMVVEGVRIPVASSMKYLGLVLNGHWNFGRLVRAAGGFGNL
ncbi:unnamed protein product [Pieris macdunnoughi]|uniref:Uncharacterized protein n=1 Tax=Pieris macdunnoughi TaxID=345717 RepID=A0A821TVV2_9NEOP|nr:unnamed protein product [Pieris macdunnoughi]